MGAIMGINQILSLLADGQLHSGEEIGLALSISRSAVWKKLKSLEYYGLQIESIKGKGYRIAGGIDLLDHSAIINSLDSRLAKIHIEKTIDSTNKYLLQKCADGEGHKLLCAAEMQTKGRGRRGKNWQSPFARNLYFSLGWEFTDGAKSLEGLSLAVGVCLARVLKTIGIKEVGLKWPNDILVENKKIAGVLLEMTGDTTGNCQVVIGVGLNISMSRIASIVEIDQPWTDVITHTKVESSRSLLLIKIINELLEMLESYQRVGFAALKDEWQRLDICFNKEVALSTPAMTIYGTALGVTGAGAIQIRVGEIVNEYSGGEISLKAVP